MWPFCLLSKEVLAAYTFPMGRLLVIDDDVSMLRAVARLLQPSHEVVVTASAHEGLATLTKQRFDAVLVDSRMPEMTGREFVERALRLNPRLARRLVLMSAVIDAESAPPGIPTLEKPLRAADLDEVMQQREGVSSSRPPSE